MGQTSQQYFQAYPEALNITWFYWQMPPSCCCLVSHLSRMGFAQDFTDRVQRQQNRKIAAEDFLCIMLSMTEKLGVQEQKVFTLPIPRQPSLLIWMEICLRISSQMALVETWNFSLKRKLWWNAVINSLELLSLFFGDFYSKGVVHDLYQGKRGITMHPFDLMHHETGGDGSLPKLHQNLNLTYGLILEFYLSLWHSFQLSYGNEV